MGRMEVILGMPWLLAHNLEIDWEKGEVKMTRCPSICGVKLDMRDVNYNFSDLAGGCHELPLQVFD